MTATAAQRVVLITGGSGAIGRALSRRFVRDGALVVITGRNAQKLDEAAAALTADAAAAGGAIVPLVLDGSDAAAVDAQIGALGRRLGRIDLLINNAGSAGARRPIAEIPLDDDEATRNGDSETLAAGFGNLFTLSWHLCRAAAPFMPPGSCVVNISTIFSLTPYFGRIPYVVPKAALNALSSGLAAEFGARGVRVLTVMPGPIAGERIDSVFARMDQLQGLPAGSTAAGFLDTMQLRRTAADGGLQVRYPTADEVAAAVALHADPANTAVTAQTIAVTNGMQIAPDACGVLAAVPPLPVLTGRRVLVCAADPEDVSVRAARLLAAAGADVTLRLPHDSRPALEERQPEIVIVGSADLTPFTRGLLEAGIDERTRFVADVLVTRTALAVQLARSFVGRADRPRVVLCSSRGSSAYHAMQAAATRQLVRVWQQEAGNSALIRHLVVGSEAAAPAWAAAALGPTAPLELQLD